MKNIDQELASIKNKTMLVVFPHQDDESVMAGGLISKASEMGFRVVVVCVTNGIRGRIFIHGKGKNVMEIRKDEFSNAMQKLNVDKYDVWDYNDGELKSTTGWQQQLKEFITKLNPGLVVTYDFSGLSGHPDHIALSLEIFEIVKNKKQIILWWPSFTGMVYEFFIKKTKTSKFFSNPEIELKLSAKQLWKKFIAINCHRSQNLRAVSFGIFLHPYEHYTVADYKKIYNWKYVKFRI